MALQTREYDLEFVLKSLFAGGFAGMCSKTFVAPLDRIKILLQAHNKHYKRYGVYTGLRGIIMKESFIALYKGNGAQMVRIFPYAAVQFTSFEFYKGEGGIRALYRGFLPTFLGMVPYAGFSFYCFEKMKLFCMKYAPHVACSPCQRNTGGLVLSVPAKLICGGLAGAVAQSVSYPMDVTRRRMQLAMMNPETRKFGMGMIKTLVLIYRKNGIFKGLYRGMSINYIRAIPMVAVSFSTYELIKQALHLDTGMKT
ncbi:solute carrier family 25 member 16-like isoform X3 [Lycorma delicatula]|uniref:solute carrier family 25 member 16-like isoform X3 n=1 Tax=Lycorma delicatula TaxID=130591 RepID=UPI003F5133CA